MCSMLNYNFCWETTCLKVLHNAGAYSFRSSINISSRVRKLLGPMYLQTFAMQLLKQMQQIPLSKLDKFACTYINCFAI